jgi:predicted house-cleaning NTP pyrophosphatase (Maf/HAM1 superfamily)
MLDALSGRSHKVLTGVALRGRCVFSRNQSRRGARILAKWGAQ